MEVLLSWDPLYEEAAPSAFTMLIVGRGSVVADQRIGAEFQVGSY